MTITDFYKAWVTLKSGAVKRSTMAQYEEYGTRICECITSVYGDISMDDITPIMIAMCYKPYHDAGRERTAELIYTVAHMMMTDAAEMHIIKCSPMESIGRPTAAKREIVPIELDDASLIRQTQHGWLWSLMLDTGIRRGEAAALRYGDIDMRRCHMDICRTVYRVKGVLDYGDPKSDNSIRRIPLTETHVDIIKNQVMRQVANGRTDDYMISRNGSAIDPHRINVWFGNDCIEAGVPHYTVHQMRHTFACNAVSAGVEMRVLQVLMGHSRIDTTARYYAYVRDDIRRDAINRIAAYSATDFG